MKESDTLNILKCSDVNKAHGYDDISVKMLQLSHRSILKPLKALFENCLQRPIDKKGDKRIVKNHRQVYLPPICGKVFESFAVKYLSVSLLMTCLNTSKKTILLSCLSQPFF